MEKASFVAGDRPTFLFRLTNPDGAPLTDILTAKLRWRIGSGAVVESDMTVSGNEVSYQFGVGQLTAGVLKVEVRVTDSASKPYTTRAAYSYNVRDSL